MSSQDMRMKGNGAYAQAKGCETSTSWMVFLRKALSLDHRALYSCTGPTDCSSLEKNIAMASLCTAECLDADYDCDSRRYYLCEALAGFRKALVWGSQQTAQWIDALHGIIDTCVLWSSRSCRASSTMAVVLVVLLATTWCSTSARIPMLRPLFWS
eukprot:m51a1_g14115 putative C-tail anchored protein (156) ;mRNA; f:142478-147693